MLHEFLTLHRDELIGRCKSSAALRRPATCTRETVLPNGASLILDRLVETLRAEPVTARHRNMRICEHFEASETQPRIEEAASQHGLELSRNGFPIEEVVHGYGDLCQAITDLAVERNARIDNYEFRTLHRCLEKAITNALVSYSAAPRTPLPAADHVVQRLHERLGFLAHELRNHLQTVTLALAAMKATNAGATGATTAMLDRSITGMCDLVDRSLAEVRGTAQAPARQQILVLADFIAEVHFSASLKAAAKECAFIVEPVDPSLRIRADRDLLSSALGNLLQNAFKFTRCHTQVTLRASAAGDRVHIAVEDNCGGLPADGAEQMFRPFTQLGHDKSGVGLGLSICQRSVEASGGVLSVRNVPGTGCVFTIDLPRRSMAKRPEAERLASRVA